MELNFKNYLCRPYFYAVLIVTFWAHGSNTQLVVSFTNLPDEVAIPEDSVDQTVIFTVDAFVDVSITVSYALETVDPPSSAFEVDVSTGEVKLVNPMFDFEVGPLQYVLNFSATEGSVTGYGQLTVNITNVLDPPTFSNLPVNLTLNEDTNTGSVEVIYTADATDPEGGNITYLCQVEPDDGNFFGSCGAGYGQIRHIAVPVFDFGTTAVYNMTVTADSTSGALFSSTILIYIINTVNEVPVLNGFPATISVNETTVPPQDIFVDFNATDGDGDALTLNYTISPASGSTKFSFSLGQVQLIDVVDYETEPHTYTITMEVCDATNCSNSGDLIVNILDGVDEPSLAYTPDPIPINESTTTGSTISFTWVSLDGQDETTFAWAEVLGLTGFESFFSVDTGSGVVTLNKVVDYEDTISFPNHELTLSVRATNALGYSTLANLTFLITDWFECAPVFEQSTYTGNVSNGAASGIQLFTAAVSDCDLGDTWTFSLSSPCTTYFTLVTSGNETTLEVSGTVDRTALAPNYNITCTITATDSIGLQGTATIDLTVLDTDNRAPNFTVSTYAFTVANSVPVGTLLGHVLATDPDLGDEVRYHLLTNDSSTSGLFYAGYLDGSITTGAALTAGQTYTIYAYAEDLALAQSDLATITVEVFDSSPYLVDWEIDSGGRDLSNADIETFRASVETTCDPGCTVNIADYYENPDTGNYIAEVYIINSDDPTSTNYMTKEEQVAAYTSDNVQTPTTAVASVAPTVGTVVSISEPLSSSSTTVSSGSTSEENFWETTAGIVVIVLLALLGLMLLILIIAILVDVFYWSKKYTSKGYKASNI